MEKEIKELLNEEIREEIHNLSLSDKAEEKAKAIDNLAKLYRLKIDEDKEKANLIEKELNKEDLKNQSKDRFIKFGIDVGGIVLPLIFYAFWMRRGFKFEEQGTYTSKTFSNLFNRFKPTKN